MNFALWAVSIVPAWLVIRHFGASENRTRVYEPARAENAAEESPCPRPPERTLSGEIRLALALDP